MVLFDEVMLGYIAQHFGIQALLELDEDAPGFTVVQACDAKILDNCS